MLHRDVGRSWSVTPVRVLLVEDEDQIRSLLTEVTADKGFEVIEAPDAEKALRLATAMEPPQVIVSDVNLGSGMDWFALADAARRLWPTVPVLLMSGIASNFAGHLGGMAQPFLLKPCPFSVFLQYIADLGGKPARIVIT